MPLRLTIENETQLPDGGPTSIQITGRRGIDIGRDQHLDWTLPDPDRLISGKHCEIRFRDGGYWLHDVSSNGTFVNGSERRMNAAHRLRNGDRLEIGRYIITAAIDGEDASPEPEAATRSPDPDELWGVSDEVAPPAPARDFHTPRQTAPLQPDFLDWVVDVPDQWAGEPMFTPRGEPPPRPDRNRSARDAAPEIPRPATPKEGVDFSATPLASPLDSESVWRAGPAAKRGMETVADDPFSPLPPVEERRAPSDFLGRLARGAGLPPDVFVGCDAGASAEEIGIFLRIIAENLRQLLAARARSRGMVRSPHQTMVQAYDNNPLKFAPSTDEALRIMLGPPSRNYLDGRETLKQSFDELKLHQIQTYAAMQQALRTLIEGLDPEAICQATDRGIARVVSLRKSRLWDAYVARWKVKTAGHHDGLVDAFMEYFAECYKRNTTKKL